MHTINWISFSFPFAESWLFVHSLLSVCCVFFSFTLFFDSWWKKKRICCLYIFCFVCECVGLNAKNEWNNFQFILFSFNGNETVINFYVFMYICKRQHFHLIKNEFGVMKLIKNLHKYALCTEVHPYNEYTLAKNKGEKANWFLFFS